MKTIINENISVQAENSDVAEICVYGDIVTDKWTDEDTTPLSIHNALSKAGNVKTIELHINSYGGSTDAGNGIIAMLDAYRAKTKCTIESYVEGMAGSMASGLAMVADVIYMNSNSLMFLHKPLAYAGVANADDLKKYIEELDKTEQCLIKNYMRHWKGSEEDLQQALATESTYTAEEALECGLCDKILEPVKIAASMKGIRVGNCEFGDKKIADSIKAKYPDLKIPDVKESSKLEFDKKLEQFGVNEELFDTLGISSELTLNVANAVSDFVKADIKNSNKYLDKSVICEGTEREDITEQEVVDVVNASKNPPKPDETLAKKAKAYDKILDSERENALKSAIRAQGEGFNENITKKMIATLDYDELIEISDAWEKQAQEALNAGKQVSNTGENTIPSALDKKNIIISK